MNHPRRGIFAGVGIILVAVIVTVSALSVGLNSLCQSRFWDEAAVYAGAELLERQADFLGVQRAVYHSADAPVTVNNWYVQRRAAQIRDAMRRGDTPNLPEPNWLVDPDTQRGGSLITVATTCP